MSADLPFTTRFRKTPVILAAIALISVLYYATSGHSVVEHETFKRLYYVQVLDKDGTVMFMFTNQTNITRGKTAGSWVDGKVGERVVVVATMEKREGMLAQLNTPVR